MSTPDFKPVLTREDMRRLDAATISAGTPSIELMERAGRRIAEYLQANREMFPGGRTTRPSLLVLAGSGNNGGDGFVVARLLAELGWNVDVTLCGREPAPGSDAAANLRLWRDAGGKITEIGRVLSKLHDGGAGWDVALDALYGTGLDRALQGRDVDVVRAVNESALYTVAVDIPSGLCADTGHPLGVAVVADATVTIGAGKPGLFVGAGPDHAGRVTVVDIGLLDLEKAGIESLAQVIDRETCSMWLPPRRNTIHKGDLGHVLVVGAQRGKTGAVLLAARGALRAGAGLVTMAVPQSLVDPTDTALTEAMTFGVAETARGEVGEGAFETLAPELGRFTTAVVGPGMGTGPGAHTLVKGLLRDFAGTLVIDADGLNVLASSRDELAVALSHRRARGQGAVILTPHPGEMGRLAGTSSNDVQQDRLAAVRSFCSKHAATLVLKGAGTIVSDGVRTAFNTSGNPGMASPGMGDVLSGITAAFAARIASSFVAASSAVHVHGLAADLLAVRIRGAGFLAGEVADTVPAATASLGSTVL